VALIWAAIAEVALAGVLLVWLISPAAAATASYGSLLSMSLLVVSMLFTAIGVVVLMARRLPRSIKLAITLILAATAGGVIPLALSGLLVADGGGYGLLLALAVIGMEFLAVHIPRATREKIPYASQPPRLQHDKECE
jgi:hypothetical protein